MKLIEIYQCFGDATRLRILHLLTLGLLGVNRFQVLLSEPQNLKCLQDCVQTVEVFKKDLRKLKAMDRDTSLISHDPRLF